MSRDGARPQLARHTAILIGSLLFLYWVVLPVVIGALADTRGYAEDRLGALASVYSAGIFLATVCSMLWIERANWVWLVRGGSTLTCAGFLVLTFDQTLRGTLLGHGLASVGLGIAYSVVMALLGALDKPARSFALVFFYQVVIGVAASIAMTTWLSAAQILLFAPLVMAAVGVLCLVLAPALPRSAAVLRASALTRSDIVDSSAQPSQLRRLFPSLPIALALLAILLVFIGDAGLWIFLERVGTTRFDSAFGGFMVSMNLGAGACGSLTAAILSERWGYLWPMVIGIVLSLVSVALLAGGSMMSVLLLASFINGWAWNFGAAYRMGLVARLDRGGRFTVLIPSMQTLGNTAGPLIMGLLIVRGGYNAAFIAASVLWVLALAAYVPAWMSLKRYAE